MNRGVGRLLVPRQLMIMLLSFGLREFRGAVQLVLPSESLLTSKIITVVCGRQVLLTPFSVCFVGAPFQRPSVLFLRWCALGRCGWKE